MMLVLLSFLSSGNMSFSGKLNPLPLQLSRSLLILSSRGKFNTGAAAAAMAPAGEGGGGTVDAVGDSSGPK